MAKTFSFEFFPPKTPEGADKLRTVRARLAEVQPAFFSVTFGAGGSTKEGTWNTVLGPISYDKKGDITKLDYVIYIWKGDGTYSEM